MESHLPITRDRSLSRLPQPSKIPSPTKIPLGERSPNIIRTTSPDDSPILKRPAILGFSPAPSIQEEPLTTSQLVGPITTTATLAATHLGAAKRKLPETGLKPPAAKRITLADRAVAPKQPPAKPSTMARSVSTSNITKTPTTRNTLSSTVGPGAKPPTTAGRPIANPRSRIVSGGTHISRSVGPGTRAPPVRGPVVPSRPASRAGSERPPSRESTAKTPAKPTGKSKRPAWDTKGRLEDMELAYEELKHRFDGTSNERDNMNDLLASERARLLELETSRARLQIEKEQLQNEVREVERRREMELDSQKAVSAAEKAQLSSELSSLQNRLNDLQVQLQTARRENDLEKEESIRRHRLEEESLRRDFQREIETVTRTFKQQYEDEEKKGKERLEEEIRRREREIREVRDREGAQRELLQRDIEMKEREVRSLKNEVENLRNDLEREQGTNRQLKATVQEQSASGLTQEATTRALRVKLESLETMTFNRDARIKELEEMLADAVSSRDEIQEKLRAEETIRRKLHNQIQELKGNIRVFCRVRPPLPNELADGGNKLAEIKFPDEKAEGREIECVEDKGESALGKEIIKNYPFQFDKVFTPTTANNEIFEEISQLVQSALDGYNVCIFAYGQTGSGKTYTMSSPQDGMIPQAVHQIYSVAESLKEKGWTYRMEGSFLEIYNENINDLLGKAEEMDKKKHEIKHDTARGKTTVTDLTTVQLDSSDRVNQLLERAAGNRSVAATKANERSSRSHSVFILKLAGANSVTGESSEGVLNLIDLAGSERLMHSQSTGDRLKETQAINKSLSCLGDVIYALGNAKDGGHVPYRNSKLTYLLQYSLGGNSKTLMFVNVSPLKQHLSETLCSLRFATKVNNTQIGTARKNNARQP